MRNDDVSIRPWRWALLLLAACVGALALSPSPPPQVDLGWDKLNHVVAFAAMAVCAVLGWRGSRAAWLAVLLALLVYGGAIELLQLQVPNRSAEWADLGADAIGIGIGALLTLAWMGGQGQQA
jgi:VanZ family protein